MTRAAAMKLPEPYLKARAALAAVVSFIEAKDIRDKAIAMATYAMHAKDADLASEAVSIKKWAERKIGELMRETPKAKGAQPTAQRRVTKKPSVDPPTLASQGVDKNLADRARKAAAMKEKEFLKYLEKACKRAVAAAEGDREVIRSARAERQAEKKQRRAKRERQLAEKIKALPDIKAGVIVADPEWQFEPWSKETGMDRAAANHYPTSVTDVIAARDVPSIAADDCALFLWATVPMLPHALLVMAAWGFDYRSNIVWIKQRSGEAHGTGYWFWNEHEICLLGIKGNVPCPSPGDQWLSVIEALVGKHSEKPERLLELIEAYFPNLPKIELNRRGSPRPGWQAWGNEAEPAVEAAE
jgi:N6-adenosine-specific RNA methylase IME4